MNTEYVVYRRISDGSVQFVTFGGTFTAKLAKAFRISHRGVARLAAQMHRAQFVAVDDVLTIFN